MIFVKTEAGQQVLKDRSQRLTPRQRSAFILFDGQRAVRDVLEAGMGITQEDVDHLVELGLLGPWGATPEPPAGEAPLPEPLPTLPSTDLPQRYQQAYPIAAELTAALGLRGFRLNLSVEGTTGYDELLALAPKIRAAVGAERAVALDRALGL